MLAHLEARIRQVREQIREHIDQHPHLRSQRDLLTSIPGIGESTAAVLLAELFTKDFTFAGKRPPSRACAPGSPIRGPCGGRATLSKIGPRRLRNALYFPAIMPG